MNTGTYGLADALPRAPSYRGPTIPQVAANDENVAMGLAGSAASQDTSRDLANQNQAAQQKAGNQQLGSTAGAAIGTMWGPVGTMIGGTIGGAIGGLFSLLAAIVVVGLLAAPAVSEAREQKSGTQHR